MTDQHDDRRSVEDENGDEFRPLPDGGLGTGMPEWLRRPPAWRGALVSDVVSEPLIVADVVTLSEPLREVLSPDSSPIDPRSLIELDDLPAWLGGLQRAGQLESLPAVFETDTSPEANSNDSALYEVLPLAPSPDVQESDQEIEMHTRNSPTHPSPWWGLSITDAVVMLLLGVILTITIITIAGRF